MASRVYECKEVGMFEPRMSLSPHADAPRNYVFRMAIKRLWPTDLGWEVPLVDQ